MKLFFVLALSVLSFSHVIAQQQTESHNNKIKLKIGSIINAERILSSSNVIFGLSVQIDYQRKISNAIYGGIKAQYFTLDNSNYLLFSPCIYSTIVAKENANLILISSLGYSFSDNQYASGMNWGGVNLGLGLENNYLISKNKNIELGFGLNYFLQERKYENFFGFLDSEMKHALGINVCLTKNF